MGEWTLTDDEMPGPSPQYVMVKVEVKRQDGSVKVYERGAEWGRHDERGWMFRGYDAHAIESSPAYRVIAWMPDPAFDPRNLPAWLKP